MLIVKFPHPVQVMGQCHNPVLLVILRSQRFSYSLNLKQWRKKLNLLWNELSEFSVSVALPIDFIDQKAHLHSEFIGKLDRFSRPLTVKYKTDASFQSLEDKFDNNSREQQRLKLTQRW